YEYVRQNTNYNSPVTNLTSDDMRCNVGGLESGNTTSTYSVNAGDTVGFKLDQAAYHPGPFDFYLGQVPSGSTAATWDGSGSSWFKIYEIGAIIGNGTFAFNETIDQVTFNLPSTIQDGDYLLRAEQIGLHIVDAPQFYISCAQITVSGGGSATPSTVEIPGYLSANDSSLTIDIYYPVPTAYTNPGPTVFT
ncbi:glycoside hydrolase family 61 protein, partial [Fistulina hepatica ATCC 64428]